MSDKMTDNIIPTNCVFCGEAGELAAGTLADDEAYVCDLCYEEYLKYKERRLDDDDTGEPQLSLSDFDDSGADCGTCRTSSGKNCVECYTREVIGDDRQTDSKCS